MGANDYKLCVSALTDTIYLSKVSKRNSNEMLDDRRELEKHEIIPVILAFAKKESGKSDTVTITKGGEPIAEIKLLDKSKL